MVTFTFSSVVPLLMLWCLLHGTVEASPIHVLHDKVVHHGNISTTVPISYGDTPQATHITFTQEKANEFMNAKPDELKDFFQEISNAMNSAAQQFKENKPRDGMATLVTSHIIDINNVFGNAGKDILAKNATLRQSTDEMFSTLNITFPDEMTKHQMFMALGVAGVNSGGIAIQGMLTREVFEQNKVLKYSFRGYAMAERMLGLGEATDFEDALKKVEPEFVLITNASIFAACSLALVALAHVMKFAGELMEKIGSTIIAGTIIGVLTGIAAMVILALLSFEKAIGGYIVNSSDEDLINGSVYVKQGQMMYLPSPTLPGRPLMTYKNEKNQLVHGTGVSVTIFQARKTKLSFVGSEGAITYKSRDASKEYIFAWNSPNVIFGSDNTCNVGYSGTAADLVKNIGKSGSVTKTFPVGKASCQVSSERDQVEYARFSYFT